MPDEVLADGLSGTLDDVAPTRRKAGFLEDLYETLAEQRCVSLPA